MQYIIPREDYNPAGTQKDFYEKHETEEANCPLCGSEKKTLVYTERGNLGTCICKNCGLLYTSPRAIGAEENYHGSAEKFYDEARLVFNGKKPHHRDKNYIFELEEIDKIISGGRLLDIGANCGFFLRKAVEMGFAAEGVEPSPTISEIARKEFKLKVTTAYFHEAGYADKAFDIITLIDVFEHITKPQDLLREAKRVLKDDGIICIKVPNGNYNLLKLKLAKMLGRTQQHDIFNSFEHVVHYTPKTMALMAAQCGLKTVKLILPLPIDTPVWHLHVGHYYIYSSPFILDWRRIIARRIFLFAGKIQKLLGLKISASPDLMFILKKKS